MLHDLDFWRTFMLGAVAVGQTTFAALYATFPWWKTFLGRALFYKAITLALLSDVFILSRLFDFGDLDVLFVVLYGLLALGVWFQFFAFLSIRRTKGNVMNDRKRPRERGH